MDTTDVQEIRDILTPEAEVVDEATAVVESPEGDEADETVEPESVDGVGEESDAEPEGDAVDETYTVSGLAEAIGWETKDLYEGVSIPLDNGESMPLGAMKNAYQDAQRSIKTLETSLSEAKVAAETNQASGVQQQQVSQDMIQQMGIMESINRMEASVDWEELESLDPSEALLKRDKIRRARDEVTGKMGELQQQEQQAQQVYIQQAQQKMVELVPEWKNADTFKKDQSAMREVMHTFGFSDEDIGRIIDPRQMALLNHMAKLVAKDKQGVDAAKRVRQAPKTVRGRSAPAVSAEEKVNALVKKAQASGSKEDELAATRAILAQG